MEITVRKVWLCVTRY